LLSVEKIGEKIKDRFRRFNLSKNMRQNSEFGKYWLKIKENHRFLCEIGSINLKKPHKI
jgi:hypothetical protein